MIKPVQKYPIKFLDGSYGMVYPNGDVVKSDFLTGDDADFIRSLSKDISDITEDSDSKN